jgi:hypothetical protein
MSDLLEPPRWKGAPPICPVANLPAFATEKELAAFNGNYGGTILQKWKCKECGYWHYWSSTEQPDTNG